MFNQGKNSLRKIHQKNRITLLVPLITASLFSAPASAGLVKVCKVAGDGVSVGDEFDFTSSNGPGDNTPENNFSVPAGPAPGGYCGFAGLFEDGFETVITEIGPVGHVATNIVIAPSGRQGSIYDLGAKQVSVIAGPGVTEVTFINERRTGFLEICKTGGVAGQPYNFDIYDTNDTFIRGPIVVPSGACSPAEEVPAGQLQIREVLPAAAAIVENGCRTIPSGRQIDCDQATNSSTIEIVPGDISTQTIAFIENEGSAADPVPNSGFDPNNVVDRSNTDIYIGPVEPYDGPIDDNLIEDIERDRAISNLGAIPDRTAALYDFSALTLINQSSAQTQTYLSCGTNRYINDQLVLCTAKVSTVNANHIPAGMVTFFNMGKAIAILPLQRDGRAMLALPKGASEDLSLLSASFGNGITEPLDSLQSNTAIKKRFNAPFDPKHYKPGEHAPSDNEARDLNRIQLNDFK